MTALQHFLHMGGYAFYVWTSYACAFVLLTMQWFIPWRRHQNKTGLPRRPTGSSQ